MSPEEMLKSLATQGLAKWTGLTHLNEMQRVEATSASPVLGSIVRATIKKAQAAKEVGRDLQTIQELDLNSIGPDVETWEPVWPTSASSKRVAPGLVFSNRLVNRALDNFGGLTSVHDRATKKRQQRLEPEPVG